MEFNEKFKELRKLKGLTQEELAEKLFVSRTAVSKWESGKGYPSIESLKAIAKFFDVTVDELLKSDELLALAEEDGKKKESRFRDVVFGLLDISTVLFFFLPILGQRDGSSVSEVSLLALSEVSPYLKVIYIALVSAIVLQGVLTLALQTTENLVWHRFKSAISIILNAAGALLFAVSLQSYATTFLFVILAVKVLLTRKVSAM